MCSRPDARCALLALLLSAGTALHAADPPATPAAREVRAAASQVAQDPNLGRKTSKRTLRLRPDGETKKPDKPDESGLEWLAHLARWLTESARTLVWLAGAVAVAVLLVGLRHWMRVRADAKMPPRPQLPSHVQSLDIRPESLPAAIGAAAAQLWQAGEHRAALSLLYRGALSRLVHDHALPIRAASTEGECVALASRSLDAPRGAFFARLVGAWQLAVYGARLPAEHDALDLCREFDARFGSRPASGGAA